MPWIQLTLPVTAEQTETATEALEECGAISVTLQDAAGEIVIETQWQQTPLWSKVQVTALYAEDADLDGIRQTLARYLALDHLPAFSVERVDDQNWAHAWKAQYKPLSMGGRLWICPSWCEPPEPEAVNIILDPGMAFGTGTHPTTAFCLRWLAEQDLRDKIVLDYGCGSGILAIAALKLGARGAWAADIDEQALTVTRENAERNGVTDRLHILLPSALPTDCTADLVLANILAGALIELAPALTDYTRPGGSLALSGILTEQAAEVGAHYSKYFDLQQREHEGWALLAGAKRL
ncbi:MAG: 50S ribosomal protein L11 methyltransferase [Gammaproteobacteria bacterium]|nr:50S ribosomal protein L11 methyltransferase [Gammaproteobacteria bacterium]